MDKNILYNKKMKFIFENYYNDIKKETNPENEKLFDFSYNLYKKYFNNIDECSILLNDNIIKNLDIEESIQSIIESFNNFKKYFKINKNYKIIDISCINDYNLTKNELDFILSQKINKKNKILLVSFNCFTSICIIIGQYFINKLLKNINKYMDKSMLKINNTIKESKYIYISTRDIDYILNEINKDKFTVIKTERKQFEKTIEENKKMCREDLEKLYNKIKRNINKNNISLIYKLLKKTNNKDFNLQNPTSETFSKLVKDRWTTICTDICLLYSCRYVLFNEPVMIVNEKDFKKNEDYKLLI